MRRRPGIQGLQRNVQARDQYKALGEQVQQTKLELMKAQLATFKSSLEEFALKYREDIRRSPEFRAQFHAMCANVGVDPLSSNKGMWTQLLGFGDFYYELGVQVVEACLTLRPFTGGLVELSVLHKYVQKRRGSKADPISEDDVLRAIEKLKLLGGGFGVFKIGFTQFVRSVPREMNTDTNAVIELAQKLGGFLTAAQIVEALKWTETRMKDVLWLMVREALVLVDDGERGSPRLYWVPCTGIEPAIDAYRAQRHL
ncbi:hypothetical protein N2152v2_001205 [Parachlorella kessleri]